MANTTNIPTIPPLTQIPEWKLYLLFLLGLMLMGIATGIGNAIGQYLVNKYIKPRLEQAHKIIKKTTKKVTRK